MQPDAIPVSLTQAIAQLGVIVAPEQINRAHVAWKPTATEKEPPW